MQGRLLMMLSSSQVLDHHLIFHIMYGLRQFHHRQNKGEERGDLAKKSNSCLTNIERKRCKKKQLLLPKHRGQELTAATWLEDPCRSKSGNFDVINNGLEQRRSNSRGVEQRRSREVQQPVVKSSNHLVVQGSEQSSSQQLGKRVEQQPASSSRSSQQQQVEQQQFSRVVQDRSRTIV